MRFTSALAAILLAAPAFAQSTTDTTTVQVQTMQSGQGQGAQLQMGGGGGITLQGLSFGGVGGQGMVVQMSGGAGPSHKPVSGLALNTDLSLGMSLAATGSKRDTLGLFVEAVAPHGPAERAGIVEGDRVISIDTVDLHLAALASTDPGLKDNVTSRLQQAMQAAKAGTALRVKIYAGGKVRTVTVTPAKWGTVYSGDPAAERKYAPIAIM